MYKTPDAIIQLERDLYLSMLDWDNTKMEYDFNHIAMNKYAADWFPQKGQKRRFLLVLEWIENAFALIYTYNLHDHRGCSDQIAARVCLEFCIQLDGILATLERAERNTFSQGYVVASDNKSIAIYTWARAFIHLLRNNI
jgi:hypothetical protein